MVFCKFAVTNWIDLFIRDMYRNLLLDSIKHCQATKDLELYVWCLMTSHLDLIIGSSGNGLSNIMRDLKRHTLKELHRAIANNKTESRRDWMLLMMERGAKKTSNDAKSQLRQPENHPIEFATPKIAWQKLTPLIKTR